MKYKDALAFARNLRKNQTETEKIFWHQVRNRKFYGKKFRRQFLIEHAFFNQNQKSNNGHSPLFDF